MMLAAFMETLSVVEYLKILQKTPSRRYACRPTARTHVPGSCRLA
jgi:hypothetical protein